MLKLFFNEMFKICEDNSLETLKQVPDLEPPWGMVFYFNIQVGRRGLVGILVC